MATFLQLHSHISHQPGENGGKMQPPERLQEGREKMWGNDDLIEAKINKLLSLKKRRFNVSGKMP